jgi:polyisoprenoid-binding protein YceI
MVMIDARAASLRQRLMAVGLVSILSVVNSAAAATWQLARGPSAITFKVSHLIFSEVEGRFTRFAGSVDLPGDDLGQARIDAEIDAASIHTGHEDRDRHLVSNEFLAADAFPRIRFVSRTISPTGPGRYEIVGDLTIRDVTRPIALAATSMGRRETTAGARLDFEATGSLDRADYGLRWNRIWDGKAVLGDEVEIRLKICLVEAGGAPLTPSSGRR